MQVKITKDQLRTLCGKCGHLDTDSGKVFVQPVGSLCMADRLYHCELQFCEPTGEESDRFSLSSVLKPGLPAATPSNEADTDLE